MRPLVIGYSAVAADFSEEGRFGKNALGVAQHGPVMGVTFNWSDVLFGSLADP